jgi:H/ACA ribonucleoprotein complex subunit 4
MKWLVKKEEEANPEYGCFPHERKIEDHIKNGIVIIDKPAGPTSHEVTSWVKKIVNINKAGHSGTLDPKVTGVLPVTLENATKIIPAILKADKEYITLMKLHSEIPEERIKETMKSFVGVITQIPPVKSAVKREPRKRRIYELEILEIKGKEVLFRARTEAGVYIRKLCDDFGKKAGTKGQMDGLRRIKAGPFDENDLIKLHDLKDAYEFWREDKEEKYLREVIKPVEFGVQHLGKVLIKDSAVNAICHGAPLHVGGISKLTDNIKEKDLIAIMSLKGELVALGNGEMDSMSMFKKRKGIAVKTERVIMKKDTYPKMWK